MAKGWLQVAGIALAAALVTLVFYGYRTQFESRAASTPEAQSQENAAVAVQVERPQRGDLIRRVLLPGSVEPFEQVTLYAKVAGYLKWIKVDIGDRVQRGEVLAEIDVPEMAPEYEVAEAEVRRTEASQLHAQAELERAQAEVDLKRITFERLHSVRRQEPDVLPQQNVDEAKAHYDVAQAMVKVFESRVQLARSDMEKAKASRARLAALMEYTKIVAPVTGVVIKRHVDPGALIQHALSQTNVSPIVTVASVDTLRVFVDVSEREVPWVKKGLPVSLTVDALSGRVFEGACTRFSTALEPKTRTMRTEIDFTNRDGLLRPGMYGKVDLILERRENVLTVPAGAILFEGGKAYVYSVVDGKARQAPVRTGVDDGIRVEINEGLTGNEPVIIAGKDAVKEGTPVRIAK